MTNKKLTGTAYVKQQVSAYLKHTDPPRIRVSGVSQRPPQKPKQYRIP